MASHQPLSHVSNTLDPEIESKDGSDVEEDDGLFLDTTTPHDRSWWIQILYHWILAVLIGVSLRMTTFPEALIGADMASHGSSYSKETSFLVPFGCTKALSNLFVGWWSDLPNTGRRLPHAAGWVAGVLLGMILLWIVQSSSPSHSADDDQNFWTRLVLANILLGAQQGMTWTTNIFMFLDILGPHHRALASGISNSTGYLSSALATFAAAAVSPGYAFAVVFFSSWIGLGISVCLLKDTTELVRQEQAKQQYVIRRMDHSSSNEDYSDTTAEQHTEESERQRMPPPSSFWDVFTLTTWYNPSLSILCCAGLMTNFVTSFAWGMVLIWGKQEQSLSAHQLARIGSSFTFSKAVSQIVVAQVSDWMKGRKRVLILGFSFAVLGLLVTAKAGVQNANDLTSTYNHLLIGGIGIGCGIGSVYCVMTGALSDHSQPEQRASVIGIYKLWRDLGYAVGGLLTGWLADVSGGSFVFTTLVVAGLIALLVLGIAYMYQEAEYYDPSSNTTSITTNQGQSGTKWQELQNLSTDEDYTGT